MNFAINVDTKKNLLAFSGGVDSTALFFILLEKNIPFDIAIINYNQRLQSLEEISYAKELAQKFDKKIFIKEFPSSLAFSEKSARDFRYKFFDEIICQNEYESLITAHQLNDKLEWFMMQLTKGAGLVELLSFTQKSIRANYFVLKPLLEYSKDELLSYLNQNHIKYFVDESNNDEKYKRNFFRHNFSDKLLNEYKDGVRRSFEYLQNDLNSIGFDKTPKKTISKLHIYEKSRDDNINIRIIDKELKFRGYILSKAQRDEILIQKECIIEKFAISLTSNEIWISPFLEIKMDKKFKEKCRVEKIPKKHRGYLYSLRDKEQLN